MSEIHNLADDARQRILALKPGFEMNEPLRSAIVRDIVLMYIGMDSACRVRTTTNVIPRQLIRFWHDQSELPNDVSACMSTWDRLEEHGFVIRTFDDKSAAHYIRNHFDDRKVAAFNRCAHPAMRSDYLRLCVLFIEGGIYVDCDDVLLNDDWRSLFEDDRLKLQPLCYDISAGGMMPNVNIWRENLPSGSRNFYVNNDPIVSPAGHPVLQHALNRATDLLLEGAGKLEIQITTGPGNLTMVLAAHAHALVHQGASFDFDLIRNWDAIAEIRWELSYRNDDRNWRNVYGC